MIQNPRQSIMVGVILASVSIAGAFGILMYYNAAVDTTAFAQVPGFEIANAVAVLNPMGTNRTDVVNRIKKMDEVRKAQFFDQATVKVDDIVVPAFIMDGFEHKETRIVYEGRYPESSGEVVLHGSLATKLDKDIGDQVTVAYNNEQERLTIVGFSSGINGANIDMLTSDFKKLDPNFTQMSLMVYLEEGTDADAFVKTLKRTFNTEDLLEAVDADEQLAQGMSSYQGIVSAMGLAILIVTFFVIALVLYFVISSSIIRRRRELGIYKAIGYSTVQLMNQFAVSFMIPVIIGALLGSYLGARYTNIMMYESVKQAGAIMPKFLIDPVWIMVFCTGLIAVSYVLSLLITWRIRRISAYALVTE
jgi:putative ABC transport system permease protein